MYIKDPANLEPDRGPARVLEQLKKGNSTAEDLGYQLKMKLSYISSICTKLMSCQAVHRPNWELPELASKGQRLRAVYAFGPGPSVPKPEPLGRKETRAALRKRYQALRPFGEGIGRCSSVFDLARISEGRKDPKHDQTN